MQEAPIVQESLKDATTARFASLTLLCIIRGTPEPTIQWYHGSKIISHDSSTNITFENGVAKLIINETTINSEGEYTCNARNAYGEANTSCNVCIRETPDITIEDHFISQKLRIEDQYEVIARVTGYPAPKVVWYKSKTKIEATSYNKMSYADEVATLQLVKLKRSHTGKYVIEASNEHGSSRKELVLTIIDRPGPPTGPIAIEPVKKDTLQLIWKAPMDTGGLELTNYTIEKFSVEQKTWTKVAAVEKDILTYSVNKLKANASYRFRVIASNSVGDSEPLESTDVTMRLNPEKPSPPRGPVEVSGMTESSFVISWTQSESDGGSPITSYIVECKKSTEKEWFTYGSTSAEKTYLQLGNLSANTAYDVRIYAQNQVGDSTTLPSSEPILTGKLPSKYKFRTEFQCLHILYGN